MTDLSQMSRKELLELRDQIDRELVAAEKREMDAARKAAAAAAAEYGFTLDEVTGGTRAKGARSKAAPKYRDPANAENTWTGRGRKPRWLQDFLANGGQLAEIEI